MSKLLSKACWTARAEAKAQVLQPAKPSTASSAAAAVDPVDDPETLQKMANLEQELAQARATEDMLRDQLNALESQYEEAREEAPLLEKVCSIESRGLASIGGA